MPNRSWPMSIRELAPADKVALGGLDEPLCGWDGCDRDARWEAVYEDLQDTEDLARSELNLKTESAKKSLPLSAVVTVQNVTAYCDEHARRFCLEGGIKLPAGIPD